MQTLPAAACLGSRKYCRYDVQEQGTAMTVSENSNHWVFQGSLHRHLKGILHSNQQAMPAGQKQGRTKADALYSESIERTIELKSVQMSVGED